jgi:hypothetical protein
MLRNGPLDGVKHLGDPLVLLLEHKTRRDVAEAPGEREEVLDLDGRSLCDVEEAKVVLSLLRELPSTMFVETETAARRICD